MLELYDIARECEQGNESLLVLLQKDGLQFDEGYVENRIFAKLG
jgi:hypothetical protein